MTMEGGYDDYYNEFLEITKYYSNNDKSSAPSLIAEFIPTELQRAVMLSASSVTIAGGGLGWGKTEVAIRMLFTRITPDVSLCVVKRTQVDLMGAGSIGERLEKVFVNNQSGYELVCVLKEEWKRKILQQECTVNDIERQIEYCKLSAIPYTDAQHPIATLKKIFASVNKSSPVTFNFRIIYIVDLENERGEYIPRPEQEFYPLFLSEFKDKKRYYIRELNNGLYSKRFLFNAIRQGQDESKRLSQYRCKNKAKKNDYLLHVKDTIDAPISLSQPVIYTAALQLRHLNDQSCGSSEQLKGREIDFFLVDEGQELDEDFFADTVMQRARTSSGFKKRHPEARSRIIMTCNPDQNSFIFPTIREKILDAENHYLPVKAACDIDYVFTKSGNGYRLYNPNDLDDLESIQYDDDLMGVLKNNIENIGKLNTLRYINGTINDNSHLSEEYKMMIAQKDNPAERLRRMHGGWGTSSVNAKFIRDMFNKFVIDGSSEFQAIDEKIDMWIFSIDTAFKNLKTSDYTAYCFMGIEFFPDENDHSVALVDKLPFKAYVYDIGRVTDAQGNQQNDILALEAFLQKKIFSEAVFDRLFCRNLTIKQYSNSPQKLILQNAGVVFIESQNIGEALMQKLRLVAQSSTAKASPMFTTRSLYPALGKLPRVVNTLSYYRRGCVFLPAFLKKSGEDRYSSCFTENSELFLREACAFGTEFSKNDDMVDAMTFCLEYAIHIMYRYAHSDPIRKRYAFFPDEEKNFRLTTTVLG